MSHRLPFRRVALETDPCIHHGSRYKTHEERPDLLPLARIKQREHRESRAYVPRSGKRHERKRWRRGRRDGDAERGTEGLRVGDAVNAHRRGEAADSGRQKWKDAPEAVWGDCSIFETDSNLGVSVDLMKMEVDDVFEVELQPSCSRYG